MEKHHIKGRLMLWPGIAEELLGSKAFYVRDGLFKGVDACIFAHVDIQFRAPSMGHASNGMVSVEYTFHGKTAHAAGDPWDGHSALDAVEIMDVAMNFRREHLPLSQRTHYVITNGGGQPNIVPGVASVWYYFRDYTFDRVKELFDIGNTHRRCRRHGDRHHGRAQDCWALPRPITATSRWPNCCRPISRRWACRNGPPTTRPSPSWCRRRSNGRWSRCATRSRRSRRRRAKTRVPTGGGSDDIGDIMWTVPTMTIRYPANIPNMIGHNVTSAMAMATPIAHKGAVAGAKAVAMTVLDLMTSPEELTKAKDFFDNDQQKYDHYKPLLTASDAPAIHLNDDYMRTYRPLMEPYYYDASKYPSYLDQLGIKYPSPPTGPMRKITPPKSFRRYGIGRLTTVCANFQTVMAHHPGPRGSAAGV